MPVLGPDYPQMVFRMPVLGSKWPTFFFVGPVLRSKCPTLFSVGPVLGSKCPAFFSVGPVTVFFIRNTPRVLNSLLLRTCFQVCQHHCIRPKIDYRCWCKSYR